LTVVLDRQNEHHTRTTESEDKLHSQSNTDVQGQEAFELRLAVNVLQKITNTSNRGHTTHPSGVWQFGSVPTWMEGVPAGRKN